MFSQQKKVESIKSPSLNNSSNQYDSRQQLKEKETKKKPKQQIPVVPRKLVVKSPHEVTLKQNSSTSTITTKEKAREVQKVNISTLSSSHKYNLSDPSKILKKKYVKKRNDSPDT